MEFIRTNNHPEKRHEGDCIVRAISLVLDEDYMKVRNLLEGHGWNIDVEKRRNGFKYWIENLSKQLGFNYESYDCCDGNVEEWAAEWWIICKGRYIFCSDNHMACVKDGNLYDSWDSRRETVNEIISINS